MTTNKRAKTLLPTCTTWKMASSIAAELLSLINEIEFKQIVPSLAQGSGLSEHVFPQTVLAKKFVLNTSQWLDKSYMNPNALFDLFGEFSNQTGLQVRKRMMKFLGITKKHGADDNNIIKNSWIALHMKGLTPRQWVDSMFLKDMPGDEIALFILCKMFHRHCVEVMSSKLWMTLKDAENL